MVTIASINGNKKIVPGGENRAHRPTHKILSADKIKKRFLLIDTTNEATGLIRLKAGSQQLRSWSLRHRRNQKHWHY